MGLESLGDLVLHIIISKLGPNNAANFACVSKRFRDSASEEALWSRFCHEDLDLTVPQDPSGNPTSSFKVTYKLWQEDFGMYPWPLVKRAKKCWDTIKQWMAVNFPEANNTLRRGASEAEIKLVEERLGVKLPISTKVLYRFCDGQDIADANSSSTGLIGGYSFYGHIVNVYLLPLSRVIMETRAFETHLGFTNRSEHIVVAASSTNVEKFFFLDCATGQLYVGTENLINDAEMIPCVPGSLISSVHDIHGHQQQDAMLLWLEEHGRRLQSGMINIREEGKIRSINLFPEAPPLCCTAETNGVQIRASAVLVPELCSRANDIYLFAYSIRMRLLPQGNMLNGVYLSSCQLYWRHWIIRANDVVVADVNGIAVIGKHPLLYPGGEEFVYESCTNMQSSPGSIEGYFTFVPGSLRIPKGRKFDVEVARFPLELPDYIF